MINILRKLVCFQKAKLFHLQLKTKNLPYDGLTYSTHRNPLVQFCLMFVVFGRDRSPNYCSLQQPRNAQLTSM